MINKTKTKIKIDGEVLISDRDIIVGIKAAFPSLKIPEYATVSVKIPSGGDYSGMDLDIDDSMPLMISWVSEHTKND